MKRIPTSSIILPILASFSFLATSAVPAAAQQPSPSTLRITQVDTSGFPMVKVYVSSIDSAGNPVAIYPDRIQLTEDSRAMKLQDAHGVGNSEPLTALLVVDVSGSMLTANKLDAARNAARAFIQQMVAGEEAGLLSFNTQINYLQPLTSDRGALLAAVDNLKAERFNTAMYDALTRAEEILQGATGRKAIIVITDGVDNQSARTEANVLDGLGASGLSISTIGLGEPSQGRATAAGLDEPTLQDLAARSGGSYSYVNDAETLRALFERLGKALQSEYVFTYTSPSKYRDGVSRSLTVSLGPIAAGNSAQTAYNPGGLIPEVPQNSTWPGFVLLLVGLSLLIFVPAGIQWALAKTPTISAAAPQPVPQSTTKIRIKESKPARIKLMD
jgi:Ca-activated chloride channel homolog